MRPIGGSSRPPREADPSHFVLPALTQALLGKEDGLPVGVYRVSFEAGARMSEEAGVHMASSPDQFRIIYLHAPELAWQRVFEERGEAGQRDRERSTSASPRPRSVACVLALIEPYGPHCPIGHHTVRRRAVVASRGRPHAAHTMDRGELSEGTRAGSSRTSTRPMSTSVGDRPRRPPSRGERVHPQAHRP